MAFSNEIRTKNLGLLVIDIQETFLHHLSERTQDHLREAVPEVVACAVSSGLPVAVIEHNPDALGPSSYIISDNLPLSRNNVRVYPKEEYDAFTNPRLADFLKSQGVRNLLLVGVFAKDCVEATADSALNLGFHVFSRYPLLANPGDCGYRGSWLTKNPEFVQSYQEIIAKLRNIRE